ncbi:dihydrodipicolinate synthase family protein, partial [Thermophilibacter provencensis]|uniref:dihydrodipicolinate synthase family protein n=1 Tax=Thermophilibacter provencensis TaxID=1852386 RepID=UPI003AA91130
SYATMAAQYLSEDFRMFSGNDDIIVPLMSLGAKGVISVWADVAPATVHQMCADFLAGSIEAARRTQLDNLDLIHALFCEVNPIPVKCALAEMGMIGEHYRQPLWTISDAGRERLVAAMRGVGLLG